MVESADVFYCWTGTKPGIFVRRAVVSLGAFSNGLGCAIVCLLSFYLALLLMTHAA